MPDWSYQTVFRPLLFRIGPERGRSWALSAMGLLSRLPLGRRVIQLMGHMKADPRLAIEKSGLAFPTQVGLGCALDPHLAATPALAEFGFGFLEIGPIIARPAQAAGKIHLDVANETVRFEPPRAALTPIAAKERLARDGPFRMPVLARIEPASADESREILSVLRPLVDGFVVPYERLTHLHSVLNGTSGVPALMVATHAHDWQIAARAMQESALPGARIAGIVVEGPPLEDAHQLGKSDFVTALGAVKQLRAELGPRVIIIGAAGVHAPADALDYLEAGADLVQVDSGLVFAGPGLPKRINEAVLYRRLAAAAAHETQPPSARPGAESWFWALLMGLAMFVGGVIALAVASTRVVLPYDESMSGLTREDLAAINDRLLHFMTHDRVTLAGTMLAVGILYIALAWKGIRRGVHWAYVSVIVSAFAGFFTFFTFLGFGYFDPFHAFVTAILFQFLLLTMHSRLPPRTKMEMPCLYNDGRWKANQWGQLLFVVHGAILIVAGLVITKVGMTSVFVHEDLEFMQTSAAELYGAHPQLVPLVAHDRATFGGMLIACGVATLLPALWGFRRGQAWLWWPLMLAGNFAYGATILVHWIVGYDSLMHLIPAYGGLALLWIGGAASYRFLAGQDERLTHEWQARVEAFRSDATDFVNPGTEAAAVR